MMHQHKAKIGVLDGLIKYMRKLELGKDKEGMENPLEAGMEHMEDKMGEDKKSLMEMPHKPHMEVEIEVERLHPHKMHGRPDLGDMDHRDEEHHEYDSRGMEGPMADTEEQDEEEEEHQMSPLHKEMGDFFNDRHRKSQGNGMRFMSEEIKPMGKEKMNELKEKGSMKHLHRKRGRKPKKAMMA